MATAARQPVIDEMQKVILGKLALWHAINSRSPGQFPDRPLDLPYLARPREPALLWFLYAWTSWSMLAKPRNVLFSPYPTGPSVMIAVNHRRVAAMAGAIERPRNWRLLLLAAAIVLPSWFIAIFGQPELGRAPAALFFVLGIIICGASGGLGAALAAATAAFLLYNFYLVEPVQSLQITTGHDVIPLFLFSLCALVAGFLAASLKERAKAADHSNRQLSSLLEISQSLQSALRVSDIATALDDHLAATVGTTPTLFLIRDGTFAAAERAPDSNARLNLVKKAQELSENPREAEDCTVYRLDSSAGFEGAMLFQHGPSRRLDNAFMSALANLIALAVERAALSESSAERRAQDRTEELKTALLSSVSHDFRTPLTAISASASSLIEFREQLDPTATVRLLRGIVSECDRLNRYTSNLLEMSRLEAGQSLARRQTVGVAEMIGAVVQQVRLRAGQRQIVRRSIDEDLLVTVDAAMFELVLVNVLDNAIIYSEDGTSILLDVKRDHNCCAIIVWDEGQGIERDDLEKIFTRFYRGARARSSPHGSGLGLAIAKGFVEALGGHIRAESPGPNGRGTVITIILPLAAETSAA
jgi:Osmosensitive K+ channel histidine kinase